MPRQASIVLTEDEFQTILVNVKMARTELSKVDDRYISRYHVSCAEMYLERALKVLEGENSD